MAISSGKRIAIVDGNHLVADTLAAVFRMHGYEPAAFYSGEEALEAAKNFQPDLAILDLFLPAMNGFEAAVRLVSEVPPCRILLMTSVGASTLAEEASGRGWETFSKPIPPEVLLKIARMLLARENAC